MSYAISTRPLSALVSAVAFWGIASNALADAPDRHSLSNGIVVSFGDLNIEGDAGAKALVTRIATAAAKVCHGEEIRPMVRAQLQFQACRNSAMRIAVASVNHPVVTAIYENKQSPNRRLASR
jgi:UrcA family protein